MKKLKDLLSILSIVIGVTGVLGMAFSMSILWGAIVSWFIGGNPFVIGLIWFAATVFSSLLLIGGSMNNNKEK